MVRVRAFIFNLKQRGEGWGLAERGTAWALPIEWAEATFATELYRFFDDPFQCLLPFHTLWRAHCWRRRYWTPHKTLNRKAPAAHVFLASVLAALNIRRPPGTTQDKGRLRSERWLRYSVYRPHRFELPISLTSLAAAGEWEMGRRY